MRIAVTGGTGFVGSHVVETLLAQGHQLRCLARPGRARRWLDTIAQSLGAHDQARFSICEGAVSDPESLKPFLDGCDTIIHVAGLTRARSEDEFLATNRDGAVNLVEAALNLEKGPRHIIVMSSLAAMGSTAEGRCTVESDPLHPLTPYGRSKAALEEALGRYDKEGKMHCTYIRAPGVYGERDRDFFQYFKLVRHGFRVIVGKRNVMSLVYAKTLALGIAACVGNPKAYGEAFFIADEGEYDWDDFSAMVEKAMNRKTLRIRVPEWLVSVVAFIAQLLKPFLERPPLLDRDKILEIRQHRWVVSTEKARRLLGFKPEISTSEAIARTARWYEDEGWL